MARIEVKNLQIGPKVNRAGDRYKSWTLDTDAGTLSLQRYEKDKNPFGYWNRPEPDRHFFIRDFVSKREGLLVTKAENIKNTDLGGLCIVIGGWWFVSDSSVVGGGYAKQVSPGVYEFANEPNQPTYEEFTFPHGAASLGSAKKLVNAIQPFIDRRYETWLYDEDKNRRISKDIWAYFFHEVDEGAREYHQIDMDIGSSQVSSQTSNDDFIDKLKELAELKEKGLIDEEEFKSAKNKLLE